MNKSHNELESIEVKLLLEAIFQYYGYDFRKYAEASIRRRILNVLRSENLPTITSLQERVLHDPASMQRLLLGLTVNVTSMFRDPGFYVSLRNNVIPLLRTYPLIRVWLAGCSTGEEAYSIAIVLKEEGVYDKSRIYATDMNEAVLRRAKLGKIRLSFMREFTDNYLRAGGKRSFSEYYTADADHAVLDPTLRKNMIFAQHNLVTDRSFNEFNLVLIRNVMIYFNHELRLHVLDLLHDSVSMFGIIGLGKRETLRHTPHVSHYEEIDAVEKLYRRVS